MRTNVILKKGLDPFTAGSAGLCEGGGWGPWEGRWVLLQLEGSGRGGGSQQQEVVAAGFKSNSCT